nr:hypothetical protein [Pirellula sp.]
ADLAPKSPTLTNQNCEISAGRHLKIAKDVTKPKRKALLRPTSTKNPEIQLAIRLLPRLQFTA